MNTNKTKNSTNKKFGKIAALIFASLVLMACPNPVITPPPHVDTPGNSDNPTASVDELISALTADVLALYDNEGKLIYSKLTTTKITNLFAQITRISDMGGGDTIIEDLKNKFVTLADDFANVFNNTDNTEGVYTEESWNTLKGLIPELLAMPSTTFAEIKAKIEAIQKAIKDLTLKDENGNAGDSENPENPDVDPNPEPGVGEETINKPISFDGTTFIVDGLPVLGGLPIGTSTKTITLTINKDPTTTTDKISLKEVSDLQKKLEEGTDGTKRTVNLILGTGMSGYTLNGTDALKLHVGNYDGVTVSEIKPEALIHRTKWTGEIRTEQKRFNDWGTPHPRKVINTTKDIVLSGTFDAFYTSISGDNISAKDGNWSNVSLVTKTHPSGAADSVGAIEITPTELATYITNLGPNATPILDITMNNASGRKFLDTENYMDTGVENLYDTLYPTAERYVKNGMVNNFNIKQGNKGSGNFETNGMTSSNKNDKMFNVSDLNNSWSTIDADILMKFKQFGSVQNLIVAGTVPEGELLNGINLAFTGDASKLTDGFIGGIAMFKDKPAKGLGGDYLKFEKIYNYNVSFTFNEAVDVLGIKKEGSGTFTNNNTSVAGTLHKNSDIVINGKGFEFTNTEAPDYEKIWKESNGILSSKSSRVISAQQQKTR